MREDEKGVRSSVEWLWSQAVGNDFVVLNDTDLVYAAKNSAKGRARVCLHQTPEDPAQCMRVCLLYGSIVPIHRHPKGDETYAVEYGTAGFVTFDEHLNVTSVQNITGYSLGGGGMKMIGIRRGVWHAVWAMSDYVIFTEFKNSPDVGAAFRTETLESFDGRSLRDIRYDQLSPGMRV